MDIQKIITEINNAFYRLESIMSGTGKDYRYFGFNDAFTKLFEEARKPENFTLENCKLISKYWMLTERIRVDYDKGDYENWDVDDNDMFCKDCEELMHLNYERIEEFMEFSPLDEVKAQEPKFSIVDIIKTTPHQKTIAYKNKTLPAKYYVLTYLIEGNAKGESFPKGQRKELEKIGAKIMGEGRGNTFYKNFNKISRKDLNVEKNLIEIGGEHWREIVKTLSNDPETVEIYLQSKQL